MEFIEKSIINNNIDDEISATIMEKSGLLSKGSLNKENKCICQAIVKILKKGGFDSPQYIIPVYYMKTANYEFNFEGIGDLIDNKVAKTIYILNEDNYDSKVNWIKKILNSNTAKTIKAAEIVYKLYKAKKDSNDSDVLNYISEVVAYYNLIFRFSPYARFFSLYRNILLQRFNINDINTLVLQRLSRDYNFEYEILSKTIIRIKSRFDVWKIAYCSRERIQLFHLNHGQKGRYHIQTEFSGRKAQLSIIFEYIKSHDKYVESARM